MADTATKVLHEVYLERRHQDIKWGGSYHDDTHTSDEWRYLIRDRIGREPLSAADDRRLFVEIAALAVAAIEAHDRRGNGG